MNESELRQSARDATDIAAALGHIIMGLIDRGLPVPIELIAAQREAANWAVELWDEVDSVEADNFPGGV
jgi:hypothetical protein